MKSLQERLLEKKKQQEKLDNSQTPGKKKYVSFYLPRWNNPIEKIGDFKYLKKRASDLVDRAMTFSSVYFWVYVTKCVIKKHKELLTSKTNYAGLYREAFVKSERITPDTDGATETNSQGLNRSTVDTIMDWVMMFNNQNAVDSLEDSYVYYNSPRQTPEIERLRANEDDLCRRLTELNNQINSLNVELTLTQTQIVREQFRRE